MPNPLVLPMTGASAIGPIPRLLDDRVGDRAVEQVFEAARLPLQVLETPRAPIPLKGLAALWEGGAKQAGDRCFGFNGGFEMTHATYGLWLEYCATAPNLGTTLARIPQCLIFHQTGTHFSFQQEGAAAVLRYHPAWPGQFKQHSDHVVGSVLRLVSAFLGPGWQPLWVEFDYPRDPEWHQLAKVINAPLRFGAGTTGVALPLDQLSRPPLRQATRLLTLADVAAEASVATAPEPQRSIFNVTAFRLIEGETDIEGAAELCGLGVQGLQRRLRQVGLTYREVLGAVRQQRAESLLRDTSLPISDIAYALGYEDHSNFSHAFARWTQQSPRAFRDRNNLGQAA